jgi:hypothetical protein
VLRPPKANRKQAAATAASTRDTPVFAAAAVDAAQADNTAASATAVAAATEQPRADGSESAQPSGPLCRANAVA